MTTCPICQSGDTDLQFEDTDAWRFSCKVCGVHVLTFDLEETVVRKLTSAERAKLSMALRLQHQVGKSWLLEEPEHIAYLLSEWS